MEANPSCLVWWLDAHCGYFVMCHERQLMFGHCILGDFRHLSWMPNLLLSLSRNLTKRWQKCDIRQSSIGQMLKSHFCHLFILVCSFRPALDCMICNVIATEAYWWTFHVRFKRFGLRTFPMIIWSTSGRSLYFRKPQTFVVTKNSFVSPHLMKICDSLRSSCVIVKFVTNLCSHYSLEATCSQSFVPQSTSHNFNLNFNFNGRTRPTLHSNL